MAEPLLVDADGDPIEHIDVELNRAIEDLTFDEAALFCILTDASGIDAAEFLWTDENNPTGCYRVRPYQWKWFRCKDRYQIDACGRSVGKSERIMMQTTAFPFVFPGEESVLVTPEGSHADSITERIEAIMDQVRFYREITKAITHRPFKIRWRNGARFMVKLPKFDGKGVKGVHPVVLHCDEAQDITDATYKELPEVLRSDVEGSMWQLHGVSKGVIGDYFYKATNSPKRWTRHQITAMHRADWTPERREKSIEDYGGSRKAPAYLRNVYGDHGPSQSRVFYLPRLLSSMDTNEASEYNTQEYHNVEVAAEEVAYMAGGESIDLSTESQVDVIRRLIDLPKTHTSKYDVFWAGMDIGLVNDPTEIVVAAEYVPLGPEKTRDKKAQLSVPEAGDTRFKILTRIHVEGLPAPLQAELIMMVIEHYKPKAFTLDGTGIGLGIFQNLQQLAGASRLVPIEIEADSEDIEERVKRRQTAEAAFTVIKSYNFSAKVPVALDETKREEFKDLRFTEMLQKAGIFKRAKDAGTDALRDWVDTRRYMFPYDTDIHDQMNAQTESVSREPVDEYGNRRSVYSGGPDHVMDALRMLALGQSQQRIEDMIAADVDHQEPVIVTFGLGGY